LRNVYERLGVTPIINAKGPSTRVSGGVLAPEVTAAMAEAAGLCVDMADLQAAASRRIATYTGAEAGIVTSGAAAGLLLGTAACVAGLNPSAMARLPETTGLKNEVIMVRSQRNFYDHAVRAVGVRIVEVGLPDRFAGAGVRDAEGWEIAAAVTPATAAVLYVASAQARPSLAEVVKVARAAGVPVLVDAAGQLPPAGNLRSFLETGADLVAFSGGKALGGPQGSGLLCGRRDLILSAVLQNLDLDVHWEQWNPPVDFIDKRLLPGLPPHGIGRSCKVGKETIVGLLTALERFVGESDAARNGRERERLERLQGLVMGRETVLREGVRPRLAVPSGRAWEEYLELQNGTPSIHVDPSEIEQGVLLIDASCLREEELVELGRRLGEAARTKK
jgi:D-glucosaminate-6-phosphate ammonia-lyase